MKNSIPEVNLPLGADFMKDANNFQFPKVWSGYIQRLRIYDDNGGKRVFVFLSPGSSAGYVGYTDDANLISALYQAQLHGHILSGYSNATYQIQFIDYSISNYGPTGPVISQ